ncbi:hypothetical protein FRX31_013989 [Thalictrum thalictroides]|uniref:Uncharacterized protein n=1 Tax=Thalictrum thalictroides TaxID=46969 RepID=A0A7J6WHJ6_THATH|nr:hypothetical protein FRX31_013989 [Thalictrum thalictroides]
MDVSDTLMGLPPGFENGKHGAEEGLADDKEKRIAMLTSLRNCKTEAEIGVWMEYVAIPLAPFIGVSKRVDGTYGENDFRKLVGKQKQVCRGAQ